MGTGPREMSRRRLLVVGALGGLGPTLPALLRAEEAAAAFDRDRDRDRDREVDGGAPRSLIRSCILVFYYGGPSHIDTFDMKPGAPVEVRGGFGSIATRASGLRVCEHLPRTAEVMDRLAILRAMHHPMTNHNAAAFAALCGRSPRKGDLELLGSDRNDPPCLGAALAAMLPARPGLPTSVAMPHVLYNVVRLPGQDPGFLGSSRAPFQVDGDPSSPGFRLDDLQLAEGLTIDRLDRRADLLRRLDDRRRASERSAPRDAYTARAMDLLHSPAVRRAFDLSAEDPRLRDRYGRNKLGQSLLLARRLVGAGVRFVTVYDGQHNGQLANWDAHSDVFARHKDALLPPADQGFAALIDDLTARGMLDETLVIAMGEFGRTPRVNAQAGRDHWPHCYSVVLAGGGVRGGIAYGASDKLGAYPDAEAVTPADLAATLFWRLGLNPSREILDLERRPYRLADGRPIRAVFG